MTSWKTNTIIQARKAGDLTHPVVAAQVFGLSKSSFSFIYYRDYNKSSHEIIENVRVDNLDKALSTAPRL